MTRTVMQPDGPIRVLVVDDHVVVRRGIVAFLEETPDIRAVAEAADGAEALTEIQRLTAAGNPVHVVLTDLIMPGLDGIKMAKFVRQRHPEVVVIVLTSFGEADRVRAALAAGAAGYVLKDAGADELSAAIRAGKRGEIHLDAAVTRHLTSGLNRPAAPDMVLTEREREVLGHVAAGQSNQDIADRLMISERTVRTHVSNILAKLGLVSRTQAAIWARENGVGYS
jgi:DNA-binding NarL/FixJ family response regulator